MRLRISGRNVSLPQRAKRELADDLERLTRYYGDILEAEVTVTQERHRHVVDVRLHVNGASYQAEAEGNSFKAPFDEALAKLRRQLQRRKGRLRRQSLRGQETALRGRNPAPDGGGPELPPLPQTDDVPRSRRRARGTPRHG